MPPKKAPAATTTKKTEIKKKEKVIEDKTFGLKNKKGAKQQKFIQQVEKQVKSGGLHPSLQNDAKKQEKLKKLEEQRELAALFKTAPTQKIDKGADPKSIVCAFFKQGQCRKGDKCKFSHDLSVERKAEKRSMYVDMRDPDGDTMETWNEEKLLEVIEKKHGDKGKMPTTDIICKHFLEAVENSKYGWFWLCPTGESCIYRHALPSGFQLKKDRKRLDKKDEISLEDLIERERAALGVQQTKVTLDTFIAWKKRKLQEKAMAAKLDEDKKRSEMKAGRHIGLSGREMFSFNPELATEMDDLDEGDETFVYKRIDDDDDLKEIDFKLIQASDLDGSGTQATLDRFQMVPLAKDVPINENLFLDEDLDALDEELNKLDMEN